VVVDRYWSDSSFFRWFGKVLTRLQYEPNILISGAGDMRESHLTSILQTICRVLIGQFQEGQATFICLFFHPIGIKDPVYDLFY
jgi:hypothetical protein